MKKPKQPPIAKLLVDFRWRHRLTQEELAMRSGVPRCVIANYETGRFPLSKFYFQKLAFFVYGAEKQAAKGASTP